MHLRPENTFSYQLPATSPAEESLREEEVQRLITALAERIHRLGLSVPALLFLEMHRPFLGLARAAGLVIEPSVAVLCGATARSGMRTVLEDPRAIDLFVAALENARGRPQNDVSQAPEKVHGRS